MTEKNEVIAEIRAIHRDLGVEEGQPLEHCDPGMLAGYLARLQGKRGQKGVQARRPHPLTPAPISPPKAGGDACPTA